MKKEELLKDLESKLNVINKGVFNPDDFSDDHLPEIKNIHDMVSSRPNLSPNEQTAIIEELSQLRN